MYKCLSRVRGLQYLVLPSVFLVSKEYLCHSMQKTLDVRCHISWISVYLKSHTAKTHYLSNLPFFVTVVSFMLHIHLRFLTMLMQIVCEEFSVFLPCYLRAWSFVVSSKALISYSDFTQLFINLPFIFSVLCCWHMSIVFSFSLYLAGLACWFCINAHMNIFLEFVRPLLLFLWYLEFGMLSHILLLLSTSWFFCCY